MRVVVLLTAVVTSAVPAAALEYEYQLVVSPRFERSDGMTELAAGLQPPNPLPADLSELFRLERNGAEFYRAISGLESYRLLRSVFEPLPPPDLDGEQWLVFASAEGSLRWARGYRTAIRLSAREFKRDDGQSGSWREHARNTYFVDELYAAYNRWDAWNQWRVGRFRMRWGDGFILDDYQNGVQWEADWDLAGLAPLSTQLLASKVEGALVDQMPDARAHWDGEALFNPRSRAFYWQAEAAYPRSLLERVSLAYGRFEERDGYFADLFNQVVRDEAIHTIGSNVVAEMQRALAPARLRAIYVEQRRRGVPHKQAIGQMVQTTDQNIVRVALRRYLPAVDAVDRGLVATSSSRLNYLTLSANRIWGKWEGSLTAIAQWGRISLVPDTNLLATTDLRLLPERLQAFAGASTVDLDSRALLVHARAEYVPKSWLSLTAHYLFSSGDEFGSQSVYKSFLGIRPYVRLTNLFFSGGISENYQTGGLSVSGRDGRGVWAPVIEAALSPAERWQIMLVGAYLHAQRTPPPPPIDRQGRPIFVRQGGVYGWEANAIIFYDPWPWLRLATEADIFKPGDYFPDFPHVWKIGLGADFVLDGGS